MKKKNQNKYPQDTFAKIARGLCGKKVVEGQIV
jgi:hypothetical protein